MAVIVWRFGSCWHLHITLWFFGERSLVQHYFGALWLEALSSQSQRAQRVPLTTLPAYLYLYSGIYDEYITTIYVLNLIVTHEPHNHDNLLFTCNPLPKLQPSLRKSG
jgi:hypothetical protein